MKTTALFLPLLLCACAGDPELDYTAYEPFDEANLAAQVARLDAHTEIDALLDEVTLADAAATFAEVRDLYEANDLAAKVQGRTDDHLEHAGYGVQDLGPFLHAQIDGAITTGQAATTEQDVAWSAQVANKALLVFFYQSVYHELYTRERGTMDEAFGYYGLDFDGGPRAGLATIAAGREAEFGVTLNHPAFTAFIDAQHAVRQGTSSNDEALGDDPDFLAAMDDLDAIMLRTLLYYAMHEVDEIEPGVADVKLLEARVVWDAAEAWALDHAPSTAAEVIGRLYPDGQPARSTSGYYLAGLDAVRAGDTAIDATQLRRAIGDVLLAIEE